MPSSQDTSVSDPPSPPSICQDKGSQRHVVTVRVIRGKNMPKHRIDTPDCYIRLHVPEAHSKHQSTKVCNDNLNPEWNETFDFILDPSSTNILHIELRESDYISDDHIGTKEYNLTNVRLDETKAVSLIFDQDKNTVVELELKKTVSSDPPSLPSISQSCQCHKVMVKVIRGKNITMGKFNDFFDTPDPYLRLHVPEAGSPIRCTKVCNNEPNPEWNEDFCFIIDPRIKNTLNIELRESDYLHDDAIASKKYDLTNDLHVNESKTVSIIFDEDKNTVIELELKKTVSEHPDIRFGWTLCDEEIKFVSDRKKKVIKAMQEAFGPKGPQKLEEVPVIGVMGSGGGFRAMTGFCGVLSALSETGILDMTTYLAGLSGSTWYMGHLYSHKDWPSKTPKELQEHLKALITKSWLKKIFSYDLIRRLIKLYTEKKKCPQPISFTDFFGMLVGEILLGGEMDEHLSGQAKKIEKADLPLPLYSAIRIKLKVNEVKFNEWVEFSPYEISIPKYGVSVKPHLFNSQFHFGRVEQVLPEPNLHFLLGVFGSAYAIHFTRLIGEKAGLPNPTGENPKQHEDSDEDSDKLDDAGKKTLESLRLNELEYEDLQKRREEAGEPSSDVGQSSLVVNTIKLILRDRTLRAARVHNFCSGFKYEADDMSMDNNMCDKRTLCMADAGLAINLPTPILLRPQRPMDLILSFDFSAREDGVCPLEELRKSEKWAKAHCVPFPPISISRETVKKEGVKECYVFKHPENDLCPIVIHFVLVNDTFKNFRSPDEPRATPQEKEFGDFSVFDDEEEPYSTFNFTYTDKSFERIVQLMSYNTLNNKEKIFDAIKECTMRRRKVSNDKTAVPYDTHKEVILGAKGISRLINISELSAED